MNCLKCGREMVSEQVFCDDCLADMEKYPVKPGTLVLLPKRGSSKKTVKRRVPTAEDQVRSLKQQIKRMKILLLISLAILAALAYPASKYLTGNSFKIGQNYNTLVSTTND